MKFVKNFFGHLKTVIVHRWWVFYYCCKCGIPFQGLIHDLSKFSPIEFFESVKYFSGTRSPIDACKEDKGYSYAWLHHKGRNKHHYEYWQDNFDKGTTHLNMPFKYSLEMFCDFMGAGRAYNKKEFTYKKELSWWITKTSKNIAMNSIQKKFISKMIEYTVKYNKVPTYSIANYFYNEVANEGLITDD